MSKTEHRDKIAPILARGIRSPTIAPSHLQASHDKAIEKHHAIFAEEIIRIAMVNNLVQPTAVPAITVVRRTILKNAAWQNETAKDDTSEQPQRMMKQAPNLKMKRLPLMRIIKYMSAK